MPRGTTRAVAVLAVAWLVCFALGAQIVRPVPVAAWSTVAIAGQSAQQAATSLRDQQKFDEQAATDAFRDIPDAKLLTALEARHT